MMRTMTLEMLGHIHASSALAGNRKIENLFSRKVRSLENTLNTYLSMERVRVPLALSASTIHYRTEAEITVRAPSPAGSRG